jgi:hypothetical protein
MIFSHSEMRCNEVVTHFEIWAASQVSAIMNQSHQIWQSDGSAAV